MKENINKKEVDNITMNLVKISNEKIKQNKKKTIIISTIIILLLTISFIILILNKNNNKISRTRPNTKVHFPTKIAYIEKEDGWICSFKIEYLQNMEMPYHYYYDCDNFKYKELYGFEATGTEIDEGGTFTYIAGTNHPSYGFNKDYRNDAMAISAFFKEKNFKKNITIEDLNDLRLNYINKEEILTLYNQAITSKTIDTYGNYPNIVESYLTTSMAKNGYTWYLGFLSARGNIQYIYLDVQIETEYLSDLVKQGNATKEQLEIMDNINFIKEQILKKQKFELPENLSTTHPYTFLKENMDKINRVELGYEHY